MLSKKYYKMIAEIIRESPDRLHLVYKFAKKLKEDNLKFDIFRFMVACDPENLKQLKKDHIAESFR